MAALRLSWSFETNMRFVGTVDKHIPIVGARIEFADLKKVVITVQDWMK
jgi:hypothetical protein